MKIHLNFIVVHNENWHQTIFYKNQSRNKLFVRQYEKNMKSMCTENINRIDRVVTSIHLLYIHLLCICTPIFFKTKERRSSSNLHLFHWLVSRETWAWMEITRFVHHTLFSVYTYIIILYKYLHIILIIEWSAYLATKLWCGGVSLFITNIN